MVIWQYMDRDVTHKIWYGTKRSWCPYTILWVTDWSISCHLARSAMNYLLYYTQDMQICQTTCFSYCIPKTKNEFGQNLEENIYRYKYTNIQVQIYRYKYTNTNIQIHILYFSFLFSIFVFVSTAGQFISILTGPINIMFSSRFCPNSFFVLGMQ
jgi:hypothetical protein